MKNLQAKLKSTLQKLTDFFGSRIFFYIVFGFFIFEALWFVFSAIYPMAFDEDVHFGIIQIYSEQWSPILSEHPAGADKFGAVARDPSFLYHYLMSFPYRVLRLLTDSETMQVIGLRLLNVAMFSAALLLYAKVMLHARTSRALTNVSLAVFVLIPIAPHLAAHINYDNLLMLLLPLLVLQALAILSSLKKQRIDVRALLIFVALSLTLSLVKYASLPLILAAAMFLFVSGFLTFKGKYASVLPAIKAGFSRVSRPTLVVLISIICLMTVSFVERYGYNLVQYKTLVPACDQVLTIEQCSKYGPWNRDYNYAKERSQDFSPNPARYTLSWLKGMRHRLLFAVNGAKSYFNNYPGLWVPMRVATVLAVIGFGLVIFRSSRIFSGNPALVFLAVISAFYIVVLWLEGFEAYSRTGRAVAVNGRYLLPILPLIAIIIGRGFSLTLRGHKQLKAASAAAVLILFLHGGGVMTFILRSDESWYWHNTVVIDVNNAVRKVLSPVIIEGPK